MAKIVLDTNIIVRAVASPSGLASELLRRTISDENLLCTSNFMFDKDIGAKEVVDHCKAVGVKVVTDTVLIAIFRNQD